MRGISCISKSWLKTLFCAIAAIATATCGGSEEPGARSDVLKPPVNQLADVAIVDPAVGDGIEQPYLVVTAASIDRMIDRALRLAEIAGKRIESDQFVIAAFLRTVFVGATGFDTSKPCALIAFFPHGTGAEIDDHVSTSRSLVETQFNIACATFEKQAVLACPVSDFDRAIQSLQLVADPQDQGQFILAGNKKVSIRQINDYLVIGASAANVAKCPDPSVVIAPTLLDHDVALSFRASGLPSGFRRKLVSAIENEFASSSQNIETDGWGSLTVALDKLFAELLSVLVLNVREVNSRLRFDPKLKKLQTEIDIAGLESGPLAQYLQAWTPRQHLFEAPKHDDGAFSWWTWLSLPHHHAESLANGMQKWWDEPGAPDEL